MAEDKPEPVEPETPAGASNGADAVFARADAAIARVADTVDRLAQNVQLLVELASKGGMQ